MALPYNSSNPAISRDKLNEKETISKSIINLIKKDIKPSDIITKKSIENAKNDAISRALQAGAIKDTIKIIELEEIPLSYLPSGSVRIHAKAVGDIF